MKRLSRERERARARKYDVNGWMNERVTQIYIVRYF